MSDLIPCTVQVLARNSAKTLPHCLTSLRDFAEVLVQDGNSSDDTRDEAKKFPNVTIRPQPAEFLRADGSIKDFSAVRNDGIKNAKHDWILIVDADEEIGMDLVDEVRTIVSEQKSGVYRAFRRFVIDGEKMDRSAFYPAYQIRLCHRSSVTGYVKPVHERLNIVSGVSIQTLRTEVLVPLPPAPQLTAKYDRYLWMEVERTYPMRYLRWIRWIFIRNLLSAAVLLIRSFLLRLTCPKNQHCLPFPYESMHVKHQLRTIVWTFRPFASCHMKKLRTPSMTSAA